jgi:hypothetical protein
MVDLTTVRGQSSVTSGMFCVFSCTVDRPQMRSCVWLLLPHRRSRSPSPSRRHAARGCGGGRRTHPPQRDPGRGQLFAGAGPGDATPRDPGGARAERCRPDPAHGLGTTQGKPAPPTPGQCHLLPPLHRAGADPAADGGPLCSPWGAGSPSR